MKVKYYSNSTHTIEKWQNESNSVKTRGDEMRISLLETSLQKKTFFLRIWTLTSELVVGQINIILFFLYIVQTSLRSVSAPEL